LTGRPGQRTEATGWLGQPADPGDRLTKLSGQTGWPRRPGRPAGRGDRLTKLTGQTGRPRRPA